MTSWNCSDSLSQTRRVNLLYLRMSLYPCLELCEDLVAQDVAPALLLARTALQDRQHGLQRLRQFGKSLQGCRT